MKESYLWTQFKSALDGEAHACRIENTAGNGISDVNVCRDGVEAWVELKMFTGRHLHFRTSQLNWILTRHAWGGRVWVLARKDDDLFLWNAQRLLINGERHPVKGKEGKAFSIIPQIEPDWSTHKPFKWPALIDVIFDPAKSRLFQTEATSVNIS